MAIGLTQSVQVCIYPSLSVKRRAERYVQRLKRSDRRASLSRLAEEALTEKLDREELRPSKPQ